VEKRYLKKRQKTKKMQANAIEKKALAKAAAALAKEAVLAAKAALPICSGYILKGAKPCTIKAVEGKERCAKHEKIHVQENPLTKLVPTTESDNAKAAMLIFQKCRENADKVDRAFLEMIASRKIFNPAENVNKFATGGIAEDVFAELVQAIGFAAVNTAATSTVVDISVQVPLNNGAEDKMHILSASLKNSGDINSQPILENYRGESKTEIRDLPPTFIIYTEVANKRARIVYLDHDIIVQAYPTLTKEELNLIVYNKKGKDDKQASLGFRSGFLRTLIPKLPDEYILNANYPAQIPDILAKKSITLLALAETRRQLALVL
jgi:hypothetical protein